MGDEVRVNVGCDVDYKQIKEDREVCLTLVDVVCKEFNDPERAIKLHGRNGSRW